MNDWEKDTFLARWLNNELSEEELQRFEASEDYEQFKTIADISGQLKPPEYDQAAEFDRLQQRIQASKAKTTTKVIPLYVKFAVAVGLALLACLTLYITLLQDNIVELTAENKQVVMLPDGSQITMTKGAFIRYNESDWENARYIHLEGHAFFDVQKGSLFEVKMAQAKVKVLGTSFTIDENLKQVSVNCYSGRVQVEGFDQSIVLEAGQAVSLSKDGASEMKELLLQEPLWLDSIASFKNVRFDSVISQFQQYYQLEVLGNYDSSLHYTGQFPINDRAVAMDQLFGPFNMSYDLIPAEQKVYVSKP